MAIDVHLFTSPNKPEAEVNLFGQIVLYFRGEDLIGFEDSYGKERLIKELGEKEVRRLLRQDMISIFHSMGY